MTNSLCPPLLVKDISKLQKAYVLNYIMEKQQLKSWILNDSKI